MPFALVFIGLLMVVSGAKNTYREFGAEVVADFTGPGNFTFWVMAIGAVGAVGYYTPARAFSRTFMALILISMVIAQQRNGGGGFFGQLDAALRQGPESPSQSQTGNAAPIGNPIEAVSLNIPSAGSTNARAQENFGKVMSIVKMFVAPGMP